MSILRKTSSYLIASSLIICGTITAGTVPAHASAPSSVASSAASKAIITSFKAQKIKMRVMKSAFFVTSNERTIIKRAKTQKVTARQRAGKPVEVKVGGKWVPVAYVRKGNKLIYDEATRRQFGLPDYDPLGTGLAKYVGEFASGPNTGDGVPTVVNLPTENIPVPSFTPINASETNVIDHIQKARAQKGVAPLKVCTNLTGMARDWSMGMLEWGAASDNLPKGPSGNSYIGQAFKDAGFPYNGEAYRHWLIVKGPDDPSVPESLILDNAVQSDYKTIGIGRADLNGKTGWTIVYFKSASCT